MVLPSRSSCSGGRHDSVGAREVGEEGEGFFHEEMALTSAQPYFCSDIRKGTRTTSVKPDATPYLLSSGAREDPSSIFSGQLQVVSS